MSPMPSLVRDFPLPRVHTGALLGNGYLGLMVWGGGDLLNITVGCAGLWDHRGGMSWTAKQNYNAIAALLASGDEAGLKNLFRPSTESAAGHPDHPSLIPVGRIEIRLPDGAELLRIATDPGDGAATAVYRHGGAEQALVIRLHMTRRGEFALRGVTPPCAFRMRPAYDLTRGRLAELSCTPPMAWDGGFVQAMPADDAYGLACRRDGEVLSGRFDRDPSPGALRERLTDFAPCDWTALAEANRRWWTDYWRDVPEVRLDNPRLEALYREGLYKFGAMTAPGGAPAGLQGPWIEDDALPPWGGDYHFNINVQMCHGPAYRAGKPEHLRPLFDMVLSWRGRLRENARHFVGIDDGYLLPHAVDDRGTCMGAFWSGAVDHACAAWVAQMMFDYCRQTDDRAYLEKAVFDFMAGVMRVYECMIERRGGRMTLPLGVSPEYRGCAVNAWGANASFQLAAIHRLAENLCRAADWLGRDADPFWRAVRRELPEASLYDEGGRREIGLWDGLTLEHSHRHHSHLAGVCPFDTINPDDAAWRDILAATRERWIRLGMGEWSGWCLPWASMLHSRFDNGGMAELLLELWERCFTNLGGGSLHDAAFPGLSALAFGGAGREIMQMDGAMGAVAAIQDMLLHERGGVYHVFAGVPERWQNVEVRGMPTPDGVVFSGLHHRGRTCRIELRATRPAVLRLAKPRGWSDSTAAVHASNNLMECRLAPGECLILEPDPV